MLSTEINGEFKEIDMKKIIICINGWIVIGETTTTEKTIVVDNAFVIRRWGTTKGIGEIALSGITKSTVLDPLPRAEIERAAVIMVLDCTT